MCKSEPLLHWSNRVHLASRLLINTLLLANTAGREDFSPLRQDLSSFVLLTLPTFLQPTDPESAICSFGCVGVLPVEVQCATDSNEAPEMPFQMVSITQIGATLSHRDPHLAEHDLEIGPRPT
jgi:hypothetical protein